MLITVTHQFNNDDLEAIARHSGCTDDRADIIYTASQNMDEWIRGVVRRELEAIKKRKEKE